MIRPSELTVQERGHSSTQSAVPNALHAASAERRVACSLIPTRGRVQPEFCGLTAGASRDGCSQAWPVLAPLGARSTRSESAVGI